MRRILIALTFFAAAAAPAIGSAPQLPPRGDEEVVRLYSSGTRALAMLRIGDRPPAPVVFDTGTDINLLASDIADSLGLRPSGTTETIDLATGKKIQLSVVDLGPSRMGSARLEDTKAHMFDNPADDSVGVFGPSSFGNKLVTLELGYDRLRVVDRNDGTIPQSEAQPYSDELPTAIIQVGAFTLKAHLDSGSTGGLSLPKSMMHRVKLKSPARPGPVAFSASGSQQVYVGQIDGDLKIGSRVIHDPQVSFLDLAAEANIGYEILKDMTLVLDPGSKRSWLLDPQVDVPPLETLSGNYGAVTVRIVSGGLQVERQEKPAASLTTIGAALFEDASNGERFQFLRVQGAVTGLRTISRGGRITTYRRNPSSG